jgi:hypothetical protein
VQVVEALNLQLGRPNGMRFSLLNLGSAILSSKNSCNLWGEEREELVAEELAAEEVRTERVSGDELFEEGACTEAAALAWARVDSLIKADVNGLAAIRSI